MNKGGAVKKFLIFVSIAIVVLTSFSVLAADIDEEISAKIQEVVDSDTVISEEIEKYVGEFVKKRGIDVEGIKSISEIKFNDLPKEVNIENVDDTNLAIYQVDYDGDNSAETEDEQVFVVTYSVEQLSEQGDLIIAHDKRQFLNFGFSEESSESRFLETATGVESSLESGYVMVRPGSITGISTNLEITEVGNVEIIIYKNGEAIKFGNNIEASVTGVAKDHDVQSNGVVTFDSGDVISAYVSTDAGYKNVITMVEITTTN